MTSLSESPILVVCEDGDEYTTRFARLFGQELSFRRAGSLAEAMALVPAGARGLLLDLDFRRTDAKALVDEAGATHASLADGERHRLAGMQGILILRALRKSGVTLPAILFADLEDAGQVDYLTKTLAPLVVMPSSESLPTIAAEIRGMARSPTG